MWELQLPGPSLGWGPPGTLGLERVGLKGTALWAWQGPCQRGTKLGDALVLARPYLHATPPLVFPWPASRFTSCEPFTGCSCTRCYGPLTLGSGNQGGGPPLGGVRCSQGGGPPPGLGSGSLTSLRPIGLRPLTAGVRLSLVLSCAKCWRPLGTYSIGHVSHCNCYELCIALDVHELPG